MKCQSLLEKNKKNISMSPAETFTSMISVKDRTVIAQYSLRIVLFEDLFVLTWLSDI